MNKNEFTITKDIVSPRQYYKQYLVKFIDIAVFNYAKSNLQVRAVVMRQKLLEAITSYHRLH